jgi:opacity protein-like surface antigen
MTRVFVIALILPFIFTLTMGQELKYERKSISYVDVLLVSNPEIKIEGKQASYLIKKLREYIEMPRFDYNPIPEELVADFKSELESRGSSISLDEIVELLKEKFVPKIIEILDIEKEIRAQGLLTEAQRNSFIATKAKSLGITAEQAMKIMNSAFIYVPVISKYNTYISGQTYVVELSAGVVWYRVVYSEDGTSDLKLTVKKETRGIGVGTIGKEIKHEGEKVDYKEYAFRTAAIALARDIQVAVRDIPEFRLGAQVTEVYSNAISFPMGKREGIKIDDGFDLVELQENPDGGVIQKKIGFARVTQVADNRSNPNRFSKARVIIGRGLEPGIYVSERPRLPIDLLVNFKTNPFTITLTGFGSKSMTGYSIHAELLYNLGRNLDISQLWVGGGLSFGGGSAENLEIMKIIFGDKPDVSILEYNAVIMKRFYLPFRFSVVGRADFVLEVVNFSKGDAKLQHSGLGLALGLGVEYTATPDVILGLGLGYRFFSESEEWEGGSGSGTIPGFAGNHSGTIFSVYLNYSLPKLGFDPIAAIKGAIGW